MNMDVANEMINKKKNNSSNSTNKEKSNHTLHMFNMWYENSTVLIVY